MKTPLFESLVSQLSKLKFSYRSLLLYSTQQYAVPSLHSRLIASLLSHYIHLFPRALIRTRIIVAYNSLLAALTSLTSLLAALTSLSILWYEEFDESTAAIAYPAKMTATMIKG